ncbi:YopX family protein [Bacillus subtilis subsp. subtilis]|uniref:YopX family protein n=1 Tax=Bacillus subtilis TaxID=1423 RepID=UPI001BD408C5|nr:YopX family protein [Bacillus subtilis]QVR62233.1 YopX family protein [Bacillus subtilis subsp. subtilis]
MNTAYRVWDGEHMHYWDDEGLSLIIKSNGDWTLKRLYTDVLVPVVDSTNRNAALMWGAKVRGKFIYDRSIVKITSDDKESSDVCEVKFSDGVFQVDVSKISADYDVTAVGWVEYATIEVIGDVYQNPELLEGVK